MAEMITQEELNRIGQQLREGWEPEGRVKRLVNLYGFNQADAETVVASLLQSSAEGGDGMNGYDGRGGPDDPDRYYGDGNGDGAGPEAEAVGLGAIVISLAMLIARLGPVVGRAAWAALRALGTRISFTRLPGWLRSILVVFGVKEGVDIVLDLADGDEGLTPGLPAIPDQWSPDLYGGGLPPQVIGSWVANGITFYRLADGRIACQNTKGRWKVWRPKKPIVIFAGGAGNLRTFLRADKALDRQAKRLAAALRRRAPRTTRAPKTVKGRVIVTDPDINIRTG